MNNKDQKLKEIIRELAAEFFSRESNRQSLITITNVEIQSRGGKALIMATILPVEEEDRAIQFMNRKLSDFREYVTAHSKIARVPYFEAKIDLGEKNRQRIDEITGTQ